MNDSPLEITEGDQGFVEASQDYTFKPRPELDNQNLYCVYIQVNSCHHKGHSSLNSDINQEDGTLAASLSDTLSCVSRNIWIVSHATSQMIKSIFLISAVCFGITLTIPT